MPFGGAISTSDLDTLAKSGVYEVRGSGNNGWPFGGYWGVLIVFPSALGVSLQVAFSNTTDGIYENVYKMRKILNGSASAWTTITVSTS